MTKKPYPSDVSDEEWNFAAPYLALIDEQAPAKPQHARSVQCAALVGPRWRLVPNDLPPWPVVYQQFRRCDDARYFDAMVSDMRSIIRTAEGRPDQPKT